MGLQSFFDSFALLADVENGVAKLRELILQLAVDGQLVRQDDFNEPAIALLERLKLERTKLIEEKNIRRVVEDSTAETPIKGLYVLPDNWAWCRISDFAIVRGGKRLPQGATFSLKPTPYIYIQVTNMKNGTIIKDDLKYIDERVLQQIKQYTIDKDDIYITIAGTIGQCGEVPDFFHGMNLTENAAKLMFRGVSKEYLLIALQSGTLRQQFTQNTNQMAQPKLALKRIADALFPLPPLEEQKRIVAKVDELVRLCDEFEVRQQARRESRVRLNSATLAPLNNASSLAPDEFAQAATRLSDNFDTLYDSVETVGKLRSTILQLAVQGKLVPQDSHDEPAPTLLRRILTEKERLVNGTGMKRGSPPALTAKEMRFDLPSGWSWARFGDVFLYIEAGWSPQCERRQAQKDEWGVLKVSSVSWDIFKPDENKALPKDIQPRTKLEVSPADFLISRANTSELVAKSVVVKEVRGKLMISDKVLRVHFPNSVDKRFFNYFNNSETARDYYARTASGTSSSMKNISQEGISHLPVAVPPLAEQKRIVAKVDQLMALCDELEAKLGQAEAGSERLMNVGVQHVLDTISNKEESEREFASVL